MDRRAKIVCTLGPASSGPEVIARLVEAGMDVARVNLSHGTHADHRRVIEHVRRASDAAGRDIPILQDLQGPKIRLGAIAGGQMEVERGGRLVLTADAAPSGSADRVHVSYEGLGRDVAPGGRILIDDGLIELRVLEARPREVVTEVVVGGVLRPRKGVNLPNVHSPLPALTEKDLTDIEFGLSMGVEWIALSFVRSARDVIDLKRRIAKSGSSVRVVAKIEKPEAVDDIDAVIEEADGIMIARGDLGIEMPLSQVPLTQKHIIRKCLTAAKPVITATQMLESMIDNPRPTRAEASDVANAILDGTDAVMLSGETAVGAYPARVVEVMDKIVRAAEAEAGRGVSPLLQFRVDDPSVEAVMGGISHTACELARHVDARAIACLTHTGSTARAIVRHRPGVPIYAFTDDELVVKQLGLLWGTRAFPIPFQRSTDAGVNIVHRILRERGLARAGDRIVITAGMPLPARGRTNMVHVSLL